MKPIRKLDVPPTAEDIEAIQTARQLREMRLHQREHKLLDSQKRWTRRHRRATNALRKIRAALRRCQRAQEALSH